jgi:hypothetical protein
MVKPPHTSAEMRVLYPVYRWRDLAVGRHRARCLTVRLPMPPVRPVRETFASYGSRQRDIMGKVHFASSTVHSPWTALRVRWVPLYCFPTLSLRAFAMYAAFPHSDYYALFDCLQGLGAFGAGLPCLLPTLLLIPSRLSRVHYGGLRQDAVGGVLLGVPSALCGSSVVLGGKTGGPPGLWCTTYGWSPQGYSSVRERVSH